MMIIEGDQRDAGRVFVDTPPDSCFCVSTTLTRLADICEPHFIRSTGGIIG